MRPGPSDEQLLRMLRAVEEAEDAADEVAHTAEQAADEPAFDPCPFCGEPAQHTGECVICREPGCLPPDLWTPGMRDPCLTLCVRCARETHLACCVEDEAGNPRCPTCRY